MTEAPGYDGRPCRPPRVRSSAWRGPCTSPSAWTGNPRPPRTTTAVGRPAATTPPGHHPTGPAASGHAHGTAGHRDSTTDASFVQRLPAGHYALPSEIIELVALGLPLALLAREYRRPSVAAIRPARR